MPNTQTKEDRIVQGCAALLVAIGFFCLDAYIIKVAVDIFRPGTLNFVSSLFATYAIGAVGSRLFKR